MTEKVLMNEDIRKNWGGDITYLFKGNEPFTPSLENPQAPMGMLVADKETGKVCCYECGKFFKSVSHHVNQRHSLPSAEYKRKYGFRQKDPLCCLETSRKHSEKRKKEIEEGTVTTIEKTRKKMGSSFNPKRHENHSKKSIKTRNVENTCPAQLLRRWEMLCSLMPKTFTWAEGRAVDGSAVEWAIEEYGTFNKAKERFGCVGNSVGNKKTDAELIYDLRFFVAKNRRIPRKKKGECFSHSLAVYRDRWGSMNKARRMCGVVRVEGNYGEWRVID